VNAGLISESADRFRDSFQSGRALRDNVVRHATKGIAEATRKSAGIRNWRVRRLSLFRRTRRASLQREAGGLSGQPANITRELLFRVLTPLSFRTHCRFRLQDELPGLLQ